MEKAEFSEKNILRTSFLRNSNIFYETKYINSLRIIVRLNFKSTSISQYIIFDVSGQMEF